MTRTALAVLREEKHLSISAINTYRRCPSQHEHRYLLRTPLSHRSGALAFGGAIHIALAFFYGRLMEQQPEPTTEELQQVFADAWRQELDGSTPVLLDKNDTPESLLDKGIGLMQVFHEQAERPTRVVGVEEAFSIELCDMETGEVLESRLVGVLDAVVEDQPGVFRILEHKTAGRRYSETTLTHDLQVTAYSLAAPMLGLGDAKVSLQVLLKQKNPALEVYHLTRTRRDHQDLLHTVAGVHRAIEAGAFFPVRDWWCCGCPFAGPCLAG